MTLSERASKASADEQGALIREAWLAVNPEPLREHITSIDCGDPKCGWCPWDDQRETLTAMLACGAYESAALMLLPEGWWVQHLGQCIGGWVCRVETNGPPSRSVAAGYAPTKPVKTTALAIVAASMKAKESSDGE